MSNLAEKLAADALPAVQQKSSAMGYQGAFSNHENFEAAQRMAMALVSSSMVPQEYRGKDNMGNAIIALEMAQRIGASPLMVMQNLYMVHGKPGWSSQFIIAALNGCGRYEPLEFHMVGTEGTDQWGCYVTAKVKSTGSVVKGPTVTISMAKAEGWYSKNGSKWQTMPEIMLGYRAASFFGKRYAPEVLMGMQTVEELHDVYDVDPATGEVTGVSKETAGTKTSTLAEKLAQQAAEADDAVIVDGVDTSTGEVVEPAPDLELDGGNGGPTYDELLAMINTAASEQSLVTAEDMLRGADIDSNKVTYLKGQITKRRNELKGEQS